MGASLHAVLFDMDGTLVDTEPYWIAAEHRLVESFGGTWTDEHAHALVGNALLASGAYLRDHGPVPLSPEEIVDQLLDDVVAATQREVPWRNGALKLLEQLAEAGVPCAMVTMSYARLATIVAEALPPGSLATVVTGDQVQDGKPHPEAYLTAAARLGVAPTACVAIEDSPAGVASARAAGCMVVAIPHHVAVEPAPGLHLAESLTELSVTSLTGLFR